MADSGEEFLDFLKANCPEDYAKLSAENVSDKLVTAVLFKHSAKFNLWRKVPEYIRTKYVGRIPDDIMEKLKTDPHLTDDEIKKIEKGRTDGNAVESYNGVIEFNASDAMVIGAVSAAIVKYGYSTKAAQQLAVTQQARKKLMYDQSLPLSPEEKKSLWTQSREADHKTIKKDWIENQPERYAVHMLKKLNAGKISHDQAALQLDSLLRRVVEQGRIDNFRQALAAPSARYQHYSSETKELLGTLMVEHGLIAKQKPEMETPTPQKVSFRETTESVNRQATGPISPTVADRRIVSRG